MDFFHGGRKLGSCYDRSELVSSVREDLPSPTETSCEGSEQVTETNHRVTKRPHPGKSYCLLNKSFQEIRQVLLELYQNYVK